MNKKPRILVVGSFMMDLVATADRAPDLGETVIGTGFRTAPGGKGANQAVQAARLGADTHMAGCVGNDSFGKEMIQALKTAGVDISHVKISDAHSSGVGHIEVQTGALGVQNRIIVAPGANYDLKPADLDWLKEEIRTYDMVIMQLELEMATIEYVARLAHDAGVPVMLNPAPAAPLTGDLLSCVTFLSPNETEAGLLSAAVLMDKGVPNVMITLGDQGAANCTAEGVKRVPCVKMTEVKDPTAAGDSFVGAFCTGYAAGLSVADAMTLAVHAAAITVCSFGAIPSLPTLDRVEALLKERGADALIAKLDHLK